MNIPTTDVERWICYTISSTILSSIKSGKYNLANVKYVLT